MKTDRRSLCRADATRARALLILVFFLGILAGGEAAHAGRVDRSQKSGLPENASPVRVFDPSTNGYGTSKIEPVFDFLPKTFIEIEFDDLNIGLPAGELSFFKEHALLLRFCSAVVGLDIHRDLMLPNFGVGLSDIYNNICERLSKSATQGDATHSQPGAVAGDELISRDSVGGRGGFGGYGGGPRGKSRGDSGNDTSPKPPPSNFDLIFSNLHGGFGSICAAPLRARIVFLMAGGAFTWLFGFAGLGLLIFGDLIPVGFKSPRWRHAVSFGLMMTSAWSIYFARFGLPDCKWY